MGVMRIAELGLLVGLIAVLGVQKSAAQAELQPARIEAGPTFYFDAISYSSEQPHKSRIDAYVQVPHEEMRFVREGDLFVGRYEVTLSFFTPSRQLVHDEVWNVDVRANDFAQTTSDHIYSLSQRSVDLDPGSYEVMIQLKDRESQKISQRRRSLLVTDFSKDSLSLSDIMLVSRLTTEGEKRTIVPNISGNISQSSEGFFLFFEAYSPKSVDSLAFTWKAMDREKKIVYKRDRVEGLTGSRTQVFLKVDSLDVPMGRYVLTVDAVPTNALGGPMEDLKAVSSRTFTVRSLDLPAAVLDLDKAIEQLAYIARGSDLQYIREASNEEEKRQRFLEFWAKRNPDPQTSRNELMDEYYARVEYANQHFKHYLEGWKTDMGMIYIRFGAPENIERHPFEYDSKPYEIWYYYQLNRQFIFVDDSGFGDYRLRYPTTDLWGRIR
jgi:GWxTD domain-containing protein